MLATFSTIVSATNTPGDGTNTFVISAPGSYFLEGNITGESGKHGVSIQSDDVTLDLNGFAVIGSGDGGFRGIDVPAVQKNLCVRNGTVRGWTGGGVRTDLATSTFAEKLRLMDNTGATGLALGNGSARDCVATGNATGFVVGNGAEIKDSAATANGTGFVASDRSMISNCIATVNTGDGFSCTSYVTIIDCTSGRNFGNGIVVQGLSTSIIRCNASRNIPSGTGIKAGTGCTVTDCTAGSNGVNGISVDFGSVVRNCTAQANHLNGILATASCQVIGNSCDSNSTGILVTGNDNRVDGNHCTVKDSTADWKCFDIQGDQNVIVRNTARGPVRRIAPTVFVVNAYFFNHNSNAYGPILGSTNGQISSSSPWANFQNH
jgi:hypothetical protein